MHLLGVLRTQNGEASDEDDMQLHCVTGHLASCYAGSQA